MKDFKKLYVMRLSKSFHPFFILIVSGSKLRDESPPIIPTGRIFGLKTEKLIVRLLRLKTSEKECVLLKTEKNRKA